MPWPRFAEIRESRNVAPTSPRSCSAWRCLARHQSGSCATGLGPQSPRYCAGSNTSLAELVGGAGKNLPETVTDTDVSNVKE